MRVRQEGFGAIGIPFHRHAGLLGRPETDDLFRIDVDLRSEAAADVRRDHPQLVLRRDVVEGAHHQPRDMRVLAGRVAGVVILRGVVDTERSARLHRIGRQAVVVNLDLGDVCGIGNRLVGCGRRRRVSQSKIRLS